MNINDSNSMILLQETDSLVQLNLS